uniref:Uncharacterized protein n=1 Tax=Aegilops tauschii subsp. strangulata TaxID=200361 RepID=A0A453RSK6_AEGTS
MAMRCALTSLPARLRSPAVVASGTRRLLSDGKGRVLSEEERAKENVYIQVDGEGEAGEAQEKARTGEGCGRQG